MLRGIAGKSIYMITDMNKGESIKFLDYEILCCENDDGIVLCKQKERPQELWECHLGNYSTKEGAMMAAVIYYMIARPEVFATNIFYRAMGGEGCYHEYFGFRSHLLKEGYPLPPEITDCGTLNFMLRVNRKPICFISGITFEALSALVLIKTRADTAETKRKVKNILASFGCKSLTDLPQSKYLLFKTEIEKLP